MGYYNNELYHWGIKGMKWGVRRYRNEDGSLTDAGKKRYARDAEDKEFSDYDESKGVYYKVSNKGNRSELSADAKRYAREDNERLKRVADDGSRLANELKRVNDKSMRNKKNPRMDLSNMSDKELRDQINRELLERQYNDVFNQPKISKGRVFASKALEVAGETLTIASSAVALAVGIQKLREGLGGKSND